MTRWMVVASVLLWGGTALLLSQLRWFSRQPLVARLRPFGPGGFTDDDRARTSVRAVIEPLAQGWGTRLARLVGVEEDLERRLRRVHSPVDPTTFRVRQLAWAASGFAAAVLGATALQLPLPLAAGFALGSPLLAFLVLEQSLSTASARWQRRVFLELPVVSEQLGMLLSAGYSLGGALNRLAARGSGACARDLAIVCGRLRQGLTEVDALREWAARADVGALHRLVSILALNREAGDLGRLIADEARSTRREVQRELIEQIERRGQQVWIPVTVATLVPGAVLLAVPFIEALRLFSTT